MGGQDETSGRLFSDGDLEDRLPAKHPRRVIRCIVPVRRNGRRRVIRCTGIARAGAASPSAATRPMMWRPSSKTGGSAR